MTALITLGSRDLDRLRTRLDECPRGSSSDAFDRALLARADALDCLAIYLSEAVKFFVEDTERSDTEKLRFIAEAQAEYTRLRAESRSMFDAWMDKGEQRLTEALRKQADA